MNSFATALPLILSASAGLLIGGFAAWAWLPNRKKVPALPSEWAISARPVFNASERRLYRQLREAFPQLVVLPKLPLVRFCQPDDLKRVHYWYALLGSAHVTFAMCSPNGKVLLVVDLESRRTRSRRSIQIKEAVLAACRIQYLICGVEQLPTVSALHALMPDLSSAGASQAAQPPAGVSQSLSSARDSLATTVASRRAERSGKWHDSSLFMDSFFAPDSRLDGVGDAETIQVPAVESPPAPAAEIRPVAKRVPTPTPAPAPSTDQGTRYPVSGSQAFAAEHGEIGGVVVDDNTDDSSRPPTPSDPPR